jgi:hypothetical protein
MNKLSEYFFVGAITFLFALMISMAFIEMSFGELYCNILMLLS